MITICLHGQLRQFGRVFELDANTVREAIHGLSVQVPKLRQTIMNGFFRVRINGKTQTADGIEQTLSQAGDATVHLLPAVEGRGKAGQIILGVVLIVVGIVGNIYGGWGTPFIQVGIGLIVGGIAQMLIKQPKAGDGDKTGAKNGRNTSFSNVDNTDAQGRAMPVAYGLVYAGSRIVSVGVQSRRLPREVRAGDYADDEAFARDYLNHRAQQQPTFGKASAIAKRFTQGKAATAPNGQKYNTDFNHDSVRARNYVAVAG